MDKQTDRYTRKYRNKQTGIDGERKRHKHQNMYCWICLVWPLDAKKCFDYPMKPVNVASVYAPCIAGVGSRQFLISFPHSGAAAHPYNPIHFRRLQCLVRSAAAFLRPVGPRIKPFRSPVYRSYTQPNFLPNLGRNPGNPRWNSEKHALRLLLIKRVSDPEKRKLKDGGLICMAAPWSLHLLNLPALYLAESFHSLNWLKMESSKPMIF